MSKHFIVVGPFCWGKGISIKLAKFNCSSQLSHNERKKVKFYIYETCKDAYVNELGGINHPKDGFCCKVNEDGIRMEGELGIIEPM